MRSSPRSPPDESQCIELVFRDAIFYIFALTDLLHHIAQGVNNKARVILLAREKHLIAYNQDVSNREKFQHLEEMQAKDRILAVLMKEGGDMAKQLQLEADKNEMKEKEATKREAHMRRLENDLKHFRRRFHQSKFAPDATTPQAKKSSPGEIETPLPALAEEAYDVEEAEEAHVGWLTAAYKKLNFFSYD